MQVVLARSNFMGFTLGVHNAATGNHPVDVTGVDLLHGAQAVAMQHAACKQVSHRRQTDMRMRTHIDALACGKNGGSDMVEKHKRADHALRFLGDIAGDRKPTQVLLVSNN